MNFRHGLISLIVPAALMCCRLEGAQTQTISFQQSEHNKLALLSYLIPVLKAGGNMAARIYYTGVCGPKAEDAVLFPPLHMRPPKNGETGVAALREIFRREKGVAITQEASGLVRIKFGNVPDEVLRTRTRMISLSPVSRYNDGMAIGAIENTEEVQATMRKLGVRTPSGVYDTLVVQPNESLAHLPASIGNTTADGALDIVAETFKGVVLYGVCPRQNRFDISFIGGVYFDERELNTPDVHP